MTDNQTERHVSWPEWPTCDHAEGEARCTGRCVDGFDRCLAHIADDQLAQVLGRLHPGASLDASGTPITGSLLSQILRAVQATDGSPEFGQVSFSKAHFAEGADFRGVRFTRNVSFEGV